MKVLLASLALGWAALGLTQVRSRADIPQGFAFLGAAVAAWAASHDCGEAAPLALAVYSVVSGGLTALVVFRGS